jgi:predicted DNA-binding protein
MKRTNFHLHESIRERLRVLGERLSRKPADLMRQAIEEFLKRNKG